MKMLSSHCVIAVISRSYSQTRRCKHELECALKLEKPIIPVIIDSESSVPYQLNHVNPICYPDDKQRLREDFYVKIIRSVKQHTKRIRPPKINLLDKILSRMGVRQPPPPDLIL